jgi:predicted permease
MNDFRQAARGLRQSAALVAAAVLSLALGIGVNVTVFSVVRELILDDVSARRPEQLDRIEGLDASYTLYRDLRAAGPFENLAFYRGLGDQVWNGPGRSEVVWTFRTSANFFDVLGTPAYRGRLYAQADEGRELAVVSYGFWQKRLHANSSALGNAIELNGRLCTVLGVLPPDHRSVFGHGVSPELYLSDAGNANPRDHLNGVIGRRRNGLSRVQTRLALIAAVERLKGSNPLLRRIELHPVGGLAAAVTRSGDERRFFLFFAALFAVAGTLLVIACCNVAGLLTARAVHRRRDLAIRKALGATRFQLLQHVLAEGVLLALCGGALGLGLDAFVRAQLSAVRWPSAYGIPVEFHFQGDGGLLLYGSLMAMAALVISSAIPAMWGADADLGLAMRRGEPAFIGRWNIRGVFVGLQVALSIILLAPGGLFARSLIHLVEIGPGFDTTRTLIAAAHSTPGRYNGARAWEFRQQAVRRVESVPGVASVTSAGILPLMGELPDAVVRRDGASLPEARHAYAIGGGENYCATLGIRILRGRDFEIGDRERKPVPVIVNQALARELFADRDPIGEYVVAGQGQEERLAIIGVAADARMRTMGEAPTPAFFRPEFNGQLIVRVSGRPADWIGPLRDALGELDRSAAIDVRPLAEASAGALFPLRTATGFIGSLSLLGLALALCGIYGSVAYGVGRRTREFGIRAALGATRSRIIWTATRDGFAILLCGGAAGVPLSLAAIRFLTDLIPDGVDPWAAGPLVGILILLLGSGLIASWIPARRASRIEPTAALREE